MDTYRHAMPGLQEDAALRIDAALRATLPQRLGWQSGGKSVARSMPIRGGEPINVIEKPIWFVGWMGGRVV